MKNAILFTITASMIFSSCAMLSHGTKQKVSIATTPPGATIIAGDQQIITPGTLELHRGSDHTLSISKPGYKTEIVTMTRKVSGATAGNILLPGGVIAWGIDAASGAQWNIVPDTIDLKLRALRAKERDTAACTQTFLQKLKKSNTLIHSLYECLRKIAQREAYAKPASL